MDTEICTSDPGLFPAYVPVRGGHPGHNRDDYMVPFLPLITAGGQYRVAEDWGYIYDELIPADIPDNTIPNCIDVTSSGSCPICDADGTCIDCNASIAQACPAPLTRPTTMAPGGIRDDTATESVALPVGLGVGLGIPLLIALTVIVILIVIICILQKKPETSTSGKNLEMTVKS